MSRSVIDSLRKWKRRRRTWTFKKEPRALFWQELNVDQMDADRMDYLLRDSRSLTLSPPVRTLRELDRFVRQAANAPAKTVEREWQAEIAPSTLGPVARCQVVKFAGEVAECIVLLDGIELPNVGFPVSALRQKGVGPGSRFHWIMRDGSKIRPGDIDPDVPQTDEMTDAERANLDRLYEEFKRGRDEDGGNWPEFTGPGR